MLNATCNISNTPKEQKQKIQKYIFLIFLISFFGSFDFSNLFGVLYCCELFVLFVVGRFPSGSWKFDF